MADESHYSSSTTDSAPHKRKYDDQMAPLPPRKPTGFSSPIISSSPDAANTPPPLYNNVPPAMDEIQLAKQRAQEIAARLISSAGVGVDSKRSRVDNGGGGGFDSYDKGFSSASSDMKPHSQNLAPSAIPVSYGFQGSSKKIDIPNGRVGVIIGKGGETIKYLQLQSGAKIQVTRDMDADPNSPTRAVELTGTPEQISKAEQLINDVLTEAEAGGSGAVSRRLTGQGGSEQYVTKIPNNKVGLVIGKGGETIKSMQASSGARIQVIPLHLPPGDTSTERTLQIDGSSEQIEAAKQLVNEVISENRGRNPGMSGGYHQQGYQARPPSNWGPPGNPSPQPSYGYTQPGAYSGPSPHYNTSQSPYQGYTQQTSGYGYAQPNQSSANQGNGYDYYSQQPPPQQQQNTGDNTGYNYNQAPSSHTQQGYTQDGYGGYLSAPQSGYGQAATYDQQQGYGNVTNTAQEGAHASTYASQGDSTQTVPPSSYPPSSYGVTLGGPTGYGNPPQAQSGYGPGYGLPQTQKPAANPLAYGQAGQSPSAASGYGQTAPGQPGYPQAPPSGYTHPGHGAPAYGAPPTGQPGYGQAPPPYNTSYGGAYSQAPVYPADGSTGGNPPPAPQGGVAKASPPS